jgi:hypothetical protein
MQRYSNSLIYTALTHLCNAVRTALGITIIVSTLSLFI